jgi:hypothetical protein
MVKNDYIPRFTDPLLQHFTFCRGHTHKTSNVYASNPSGGTVPHRESLKNIEYLDIFQGMN